MKGSPRAATPQTAEYGEGVEAFRLHGIFSGPEVRPWVEQQSLVGELDVADPAVSFDLGGFCRFRLGPDSHVQRCLTSGRVGPDQGQHAETWR